MSFPVVSNRSHTPPPCRGRGCHIHLDINVIDILKTHVYLNIISIHKHGARLIHIDP